MKNLLFLYFILCFSISYAQNAPKIEFNVIDNTIDFGAVYRDDDSGVRVFEFKNVGTAPLIIYNVLSSCGCTVPSKPTEPILPGQSSKIEIKYNMNPGLIQKSITVESNAINYPDGKIILSIKGEVFVKEVLNLLAKKKPIMGN